MVCTFHLLYHVLQLPPGEQWSALSTCYTMYSNYPLGDGWSALHLLYPQLPPGRRVVCTFHLLYHVLQLPPGEQWSALSSCYTMYSQYTLRGQGVCTFHFLYHVLLLSPEGRGGGVHFLLTIQCTPSPLGGAGGLYFPLCKPCTLTTPWGADLHFPLSLSPLGGRGGCTFTPIHPSLVATALVHHISVAKFYAVQSTLLKTHTTGTSNNIV